jgi:excinuclease ABC subunit A
MIYCPLPVQSTRTINNELNILISKGFTRIKLGEEIMFVEKVLEDLKSYPDPGEIKILIDRTIVRPDDEETRYRIADSIQTAFFEGQGNCIVEIDDLGEKEFSDRFELDGIQFEEPSANLFSFNNPYGACKKCEGFGKILGIDENLVIPIKVYPFTKGLLSPGEVKP